MKEARFLYYEKDGERHDAGLHDDILAGDHDDAHDVSRQLLRDRGWSEDAIEKFIGGDVAEAPVPEDTPEDEAPELDADLLEIAEGAPPSVIEALHAEQKRRNAGKPQPKAAPTEDHKLKKRTGRFIHLHL